MFIPITSVAKPRLTRRDRWAHRPVVDKYFAFCDELRLKYNQPLPEAVLLKFYLPMPPSWSKRKREAHAGLKHQQKPDIDNLCKAVLDALAPDDSYVHTIYASKTWASDLPGIEIEVLQWRM